MPSIRLQAPADRTGDWLITDGLARFAANWCPNRNHCARRWDDIRRLCTGHGRWSPVEPLTLDRFVPAALTGAAQPRRLRQWSPDCTNPIAWITRPSLDAEDAELRAAEQLRTILDKAAEARRRHQEFTDALLARQNALTAPAVKYIRAATGKPARAAMPEPDLAMGIPILERGQVRALVCPIAGRIPPVRDNLTDIVLFVADEGERRRIAAVTRPEQRIVKLTIPQTTAPAANSRSGGV